MSDSKVVDIIVGEMRSGFDGVNKRLDALSKQHVETRETVAAHGARLSAIDREIRDLKRAPSSDKPSWMPKGKVATLWGGLAVFVAVALKLLVF